MPRHVSVSTRPLDLAFALRQASVLVGYGSVGVTSRGVTAGVPQLIIPSDIEKKMVAWRIVGQGLGLAIEPPVTSQSIDAALDVLLEDRSYRNSCELVQSRFEASPPQSFEAAVCNGLHALGLGQSPGSGFRAGEQQPT